MVSELEKMAEISFYSLVGAAFTILGVAVYTLL